MKTDFAFQMNKGRKLEKVFILGEHRLATGRSGSLKFFNTPINLCIVASSFVPYCYAFVQDCNVKKIQYVTMPCRNLSEHWTTLRYFIYP